MAARLTLVRVGKGFYRTRDERFEVCGFYASDDYGTGMRWYWRPVNGEAHDMFDTKLEAVLALEEFLNQQEAVR